MGLFGGKPRERVSAEVLIVDADVYTNIGGADGVYGGPSEKQLARSAAVKTARFHVRITLPDGGPEVTSQTPKITGDGPHIRQIAWAKGRVRTYVLYDPAHPGKCEIDSERLEREFGAIERPDGEQRRLAIPYQESLAVNVTRAGVAQALPGMTRPAEGADDVGKLSELAELHASGALSNEEFAAAKARLLGI